MWLVFIFIFYNLLGREKRELIKTIVFSSFLSDIFVDVYVRLARRELLLRARKLIIIKRVIIIFRTIKTLTNDDIINNTHYLGQSRFRADAVEKRNIIPGNERILPSWFQLFFAFHAELFSAVQGRLDPHRTTSYRESYYLK